MIGLNMSTFYYKPKVSRVLREAQDADIKDKIEALQEKHTNCRGYRTIQAYLLKDYKLVVNSKKIRRIMRKYELIRRSRRRFVVTTDSNHGFKVYPNLLKGMEITDINQVYVSDITYIRILTGFVFLAVILDLFTRKAVGWALAKRIDHDLTLAALRMAIQRQKPKPGVIHHSDRGVQYAAHEYVDYLRECKFEISMSAKGNPYDNAVAESFMKTYKYDEVYLSDYESFGEALQNTGRFIEDVYNAKRLHSSLGYVPPNEFEENWLKKQGGVLTLPGSENCLLANLNAENSAENLEKGGILATI